MSLCLNPLIARWAVAVFEVYCQTTLPFLVHLLLETLLVKDMLATKLDNTFLAKSLDIADNTIRVSIFSHCQVFILRYAILVKTRRMNLFTRVTITRMAAVKERLTALPWLLSALTLSAEVHALSLNGSLAKSTLFHGPFFLILLAVHAKVIWFNLASNTKVCGTGWAPDSIPSHMISCSLCYYFSIVFLHEYHFISLFKVKFVATFTLH